MNKYLVPTEILDWQFPDVFRLAQELASESTDVLEISRNCFEWVRDNILHSGDHKSDISTCIASKVLQQKTGWCFAKSHLLASLLRANEIPAGLCYQRLIRDDGSFTLHGLNAVFLPEFGWYRIDPRGNKPGINTQFCPPRERLAWPVEADGEVDYPEIWADTMPIISECHNGYVGFKEISGNFPDCAMIQTQKVKQLLWTSGK